MPAFASLLARHQSRGRPKASAKNTEIAAPTKSACIVWVRGSDAGLVRIQNVVEERFEDDTRCQGEVVVHFGEGFSRADGLQLQDPILPWKRILIPLEDDRYRSEFLR